MLDRVWETTLNHICFVGEPLLLQTWESILNHVIVNIRELLLIGTWELMLDRVWETTLNHI
ncbi:hypothetical protein P3T76_008597 [Phytophthora citrophthora]|uniref:Uncharacterized protein n=1 Tax=Phytophthora citrophthora TaxID=4793 RepID=A0AAD9GJB2_9STRA|nr:hypothetical protein P3T76_008597 [Phytophthora citrophthora]